MNLSNSKARILGALLILFGVLQTMSGQIQTLMPPDLYGWYTIVIGVAVIVLGTLKKGSGGLIKSNRTWLLGVALATLGAVQQFTDQLQVLLSPTAFTLFNIFVGAGIAVLGYLNAQDSDPV